MNRWRSPTMMPLALLANAALAQEITANSVRYGGYTLVNLRLGYARDRGPWQWSVFGGANNLFDESYNASTRINAAVGRYFESGSGVEIKWVY